MTANSRGAGQTAKRMGAALWRIAGSLRWCDWLFMVAFAVSAVYSLTPILTGDSGGYVPSGETFTDPARAVAPGAISSWGDISFTGNSFRAWPATLFYGLFPGGDGLLGMGGRVLVQWILVMLVTVYFARALTGRDALGRASIPVRLVVYLMALSATSITHAVTIGAEGPSYVLALAAVGLLLNVVWRTGTAAWTLRDTASVAGALVLAVVLSVARFTGIVLVVAVAGVIAWVVIRRVPASGWRNGRTVGLILAGLGTLGGVAYVMGVSANQSLAWQPTSEKAYRVFFAISPQLNPRFAADYAAALPDDAPKCLKQFDPNIKTWSELGNYGPQVCGTDGLRWIEDNYTRVTLNYWVTNPGSAKSWALQGAAFASSPWTYPGARSVIPAVVDLVYFTSNPEVNNAALFWVLAPLGALVIVIGLAMLTRGKPRARDALPAGPLTVLALFAWLAFVLSYMDIWDSHPRKAWPFYLVALTLGITALVHALFQWRDERGFSRSG